MDLPQCRQFHRMWSWSSYYSVLITEVSCRHQKYKGYNIFFYFQVKYRSCCQQGCRFFDLVHLIDDNKNLDLNITKDACQACMCVRFLRKFSLISIDLVSCKVGPLSPMHDISFWTSWCRKWLWMCSLKVSSHRELIRGCIPSWGFCMGSLVFNSYYITNCF